MKTAPWQVPSHSSPFPQHPQPRPGIVTRSSAFSCFSCWISLRHDSYGSYFIVVVTWRRAILTHSWSCFTYSKCFLWMPYTGLAFAWLWRKFWETLHSSKLSLFVMPHTPNCSPKRAKRRLCGSPYCLGWDLRRPIAPSQPWRNLWWDTEVLEREPTAWPTLWQPREPQHGISETSINLA